MRPSSSSSRLATPTTSAEKSTGTTSMKSSRRKICPTGCARWTRVHSSQGAPPPSALAASPAAVPTTMATSIFLGAGMARLYTDVVDRIIRTRRGIPDRTDRSRAREVRPPKPTPPKPTLVLIGGSGFLGRQMSATLRDRYDIHVLARRTERAVGFTPHRDVHWTQVDIGDRPWLGHAFEKLRAPAPPPPRRPPGRPLRLHRQESPGVPAHQRRRAAQRARALQGAAPRLLRLRELARRLRLPAPGEGPHRGEPARRRPHLRRHQADRRGDGARVPAALPHRHRAHGGALLRLVRVPAALLLPAHLAVERLEPQRPGRPRRLGHPLPPRPLRGAVLRADPRGAPAPLARRRW